MELLTPHGIAGVAIVRATALERAAVLAALVASDGTPVAPRPGAIQRARLRLDGRVVDDVLVVDRAAAGLELHLHGSPGVLAALRERFAVVRPEPRSPAERLLREALCVEQFDLALEQCSLATRAQDLPAFVAALAAQPVAARGRALAAALARSRIALAMATPFPVVLAGRQNAGKSTLFNRLVGRDRALTGATPGLTRDPLRETTALAGYPYSLSDTAGEGPVASALDREAIERGREHRAGALVVLVVDAARGPSDEDRALLPACDLVVANKADLPAAPWPADVPRHAAVSAAHGEHAAVRAAVGELLRVHRGLPPAGPVGGCAALDVAQHARLVALAADSGDCGRPVGPA